MKTRPFAKVRRLLIVGMFIVTGLMLLSGFTGIARAATDATQLNVPFVSQYQGQAQQNYDCGPASVAMVLKYYKKAPSASSDSDLLIKIRAATGNSDGDTSFGDLENALHAYHVSYSEISNAASPQPDTQVKAMQKAIDAKKLVIALVHGADLGRGNRYGDHWLVVTGFSSDGKKVSLNDPDDQPSRGSGWIRGGKITLSMSTFKSALYDAAPGPYGIVAG